MLLPQAILPELKPVVRPLRLCTPGSLLPSLLQECFSALLLGLLLLTACAGMRRALCIAAWWTCRAMHGWAVLNPLLPARTVQAGFRLRVVSFAQVDMRREEECCIVLPNSVQVLQQCEV